MSLARTENESASYLELSQEFRELYPTALRALQLIPKMYNRLTIVDNYSHKQAITKIFEDHKELPGFSKRNIYRALPQDNTAIPRRVMSKRHKSSGTEPQITYSLSGTEKHKATELKESDNKSCPNCQLLKSQKEELEEALKASAGPITATNYVPQIQRLTVLKERHTELIDSMEKSIEFIYLEFDKNGTLLSVIPDSYYKKFRKRDEEQTV
jgi:hypothetical protein